MEQINIENELRDVVSRIITQVDLATKQGRLDVNLTLEDSLIPVLKEVFQLPNLINLNSKVRNYPGIDLGDEYDRVSFQITATANLEKVKKTVSVFLENGFQSNFDELYILILSRKQSSYSQESIERITAGQIQFDTKKNILDLSDVLGKITNMRLTAQKRMLHEFKLILGEVDGFLQLATSEQSTQSLITTNYSPLGFPEEVYVSELNIDEKDVLSRARSELNFKKRKYGKSTVVRLAMVLNGPVVNGWSYHNNRLFTFFDPKNSEALRTIVDLDSTEQLNATDLTMSEHDEYRNVFKDLLRNTLIDEISEFGVNWNNQERCFYFVPMNDEDIRKEDWVGKKKATRTVFEKKMNPRDSSKLLHYKHISFSLSFQEISGQWFAQIVPSWLYTFNLYRKSFSHEKSLKAQKRLDNSSTVKNITRFIAFFLTSKLTEKQSILSLSPLLQLECEYPEVVGVEDVEVENED